MQQQAKVKGLVQLAFGAREEWQKMKTAKNKLKEDKEKMKLVMNEVRVCMLIYV